MENFDEEKWAEDVMNYALQKARVLTSGQYADAFRELSNAALAEYKECFED